MEKKVNIQDVAQAASVSPATVSRVINNSPGVRPETRKAIMRAICELEYAPGIKIIEENNNKLIGLMVGDIRNPFFSNMTYLLQEQFLQHGYLVAPFSNKFDSQREKALLDTIKQQNLAAMVLVSSMDSENLREVLKDIHCPVTLADRMIEGFKGNIVIQDNFQAGYMATKHLIDLGYEKIAFLSGNTSSASSMKRVEGYKKALLNAFLDVDETMIMPGEMGIERGYTAGMKYIEHMDVMPKAVLIANDMTAIGFLEACKECGVRIPEDISVVSFDDIELSSMKSINLTTVRQPIEEMSRRVCELTIKAINEPGSREGGRVMLEPELIIRGSTCKNSRR